MFYNSWHNNNRHIKSNVLNVSYNTNNTKLNWHHPHVTVQSGQHLMAWNLPGMVYLVCYIQGFPLLSFGAVIWFATVDQCHKFTDIPQGCLIGPGKWWDCRNTNEMTLKDMSKIDKYYTHYKGNITPTGPCFNTNMVFQGTGIPLKNTKNTVAWTSL